eukprot:GHVO01048178.1.p1 GENE.GHVO01048178.1~~GHVO01048178.1.p1  ORF type:complete len:138 (+),score=9.71 GHVO01048178.1:34-447(+)
MDSLYAQSFVILALRDTLKELTDNFFIRRDVAEKIHANGCHAVCQELTSRPKAHSNIEMRGRLQLYKFRRSIWTMYLKEGYINIGSVNGPSRPMPIPKNTCIKIVAVDHKLWERATAKVRKERSKQNDDDEDGDETD